MKTDTYWRIPTDRHGGVLRTAHNDEKVSKWWPKETKWKLELQLRSAVRHSSVWFIFYNVMDEKQNFPFSLNSFVDMLRETAMVNGRVLGEYGVQKLGTIYTMKFLGTGRWDASM